jgi:signal transduction histidine kinase
MDATRLGVIAALPFALVTSALLAMYAAVVVEGSPALLVLVSEFVALLLVNLLINRVVVSARPEMTLVSGVPARELARRVGILALALGASAIVAMAVWRIVAGSEAQSGIPVLAGAVLLIGLMFTSFTAIRTANARDVSMMQAQRDSLQWHLARAREVERLNNQRLSRFLHGRIQAVLLSASARLESLASDESQRHTEDIRIMLSDALAAMSAEDDAAFNFDAMIEELVQTWDGVASIECKIASDVVLDAVSARTVYNIILEATSDAIKHAGATTVDVSIASLGADRALVTVSNDVAAESVSVDTGVGLGSKLLDDVAIEWNRARAADRTLLSVVVPVAD